MAADDMSPWRDRISDGSRPTRLPVRKVAIGAGLAAYCWVAGAMAPFTLRSLIGVLVPGAVLGVIAYGCPPHRIPPPERMDIAGFSYWAIGVAALFEWEASAFIGGSTWWHPSLTELVDPLISAHPVKSAAMLAWLLSGWALVRRCAGEPVSQ